MKVAAVSVLCQDPRVWDAMTDAGTPCPARGAIGAEAETYWSNNPDQIPDGSKYKPEYVQQKVVEQPKGDNSCLLYTSPSPRDGLLSRMPSSA